MAKKYVTVTLHLHVGMHVIFFDDDSQPERYGVIVHDKNQATAVVRFFSDGEQHEVPKSKLRTVVECYYKSPFCHYLAHKFENA